MTGDSPSHDGYLDRDNSSQPNENDEEAHLLASDQFEIDETAVLDGDPVTRRRVRWSQWFRGQPTPRIQAIKPYFPSLQRLPIQFLDHHIPKESYRRVAYAVLLLFWAAAFFPAVWYGGVSTKDADGNAVVNLDCISSFWGIKNLCGVNGVDCEPFSNLSFSFKCPASCSAVQLLNPRTIGAQEVDYHTLIVGDQFYRGDSWICPSAIHAGVVSDIQGGCGRVSLVGQREEYPGVERNGLESIPFDSYFPKTFTVTEDKDIVCHRLSPFSILTSSLLFTVTLSLFTKSPSVQFFTTFIAIFLHVAFVSDPPTASRYNTSVLPDHTSKFAERFLPAMFCAVILYKTCVKKTLAGLDAQLEKTLLWSGGFWVGALSNYTFEWIPISRLTAHDLEQQPGAKASLAIIVVLLVLIIAGQIYYFWLEHRLLKYLALYGLFVFGIIACIFMPGVQLRIHHYVLALLLLPGTSVQTRPSLLYQGILLGLFVNGVARWGFASVLETAAALRGDARFGSLLPVMSPSISASNISFAWEIPPAYAQMDGISMLVNDVERSRYFFTHDQETNGFTWSRNAQLELPEYFRFAYIKDRHALDYTKAGILFANGTWKG